MLKSRTIAGRISGFDPSDLEDPEYLPPVVFTDPSAIPAVLPPGATVDDVELPSTWEGGPLNGDKLTKYFGIGAELQKHGVLPGGFDFGTAATMVGTGLALGGPIGAGVAAILFVFKSLVSGGPSEWDTSGVGVHAYAATMLPEAFAGTNGWARANAPGAFSSVPNLRKAFLAWTVKEYEKILDPLERLYSGIPNCNFFRDDGNWAGFGQNAPSPAQRDQLRQQAPVDGFPSWVRDQYTLMGIDMDASIAERRAGNKANGFVMRNLGMEVTGLKRNDIETDDSGAGMVLVAVAAAYALTQK